MLDSKKKLNQLSKIHLYSRSLTIPKNKSKQCQKENLKWSSMLGIVK